MTVLFRRRRSQALVDKESAVRTALNQYTIQLHWAVRRLQQSLGWLPAFQARVLGARSRWKSAVAAVRNRHINGTVPRMLFGAMPSTEGLLERIHTLEVLPLEEELRHLRKQAVQQQIRIRDVIERWKALQPLVSDPHQPPLAVGAADLSDAFIAALEGRMQAVRQSRVQRYVLALHACRRLWARGLVAARGGKGSEADLPQLRAALEAVVVSPAPILPQQLKRIDQHLAGLRATLRMPIVECVNSIRVRALCRPRPAWLVLRSAAEKTERVGLWRCSFAVVPTVTRPHHVFELGQRPLSERRTMRHTLHCPGGARVCRPAWRVGTPVHTLNVCRSPSRPPYCLCAYTSVAPHRPSRTMNSELTLGRGFATAAGAASGVGRGARRRGGGPPSD